MPGNKKASKAESPAKKVVEPEPASRLKPRLLKAQ